MGLSQEFLRENSNNLEVVLMRMADSFKAHAAGASADAIAQQTLGRAGSELIPFLQLGSAGIADLIQRQKELGDNINGPTAEAMEKYRQEVKDLDAAWQGFWITISSKVMPTLTSLFSLINGINTKGFDATVVTRLDDRIGALRTELGDLQVQAAGESGLSKWWDTRKINALIDQIHVLERTRAQMGGVAPGASPVTPETNATTADLEFGKGGSATPFANVKGGDECSNSAPAWRISRRISPARMPSSRRTLPNCGARRSRAAVSARRSSSKRRPPRRMPKSNSPRRSARTRSPRRASRSRRSARPRIRARCSASSSNASIGRSFSPAASSPPTSESRSSAAITTLLRR